MTKKNKSKTPLWKLIPKNEVAKQYCRDFFYRFGKDRMCDRMYGWNGNNFTFSSVDKDQEWGLVSPEGVEMTLAELTTEMTSVEGCHAPDKYWTSWVLNIERDVPLAEMEFEGLNIQFWYLRPCLNRTFKNERDYEFRICSYSTKRLVEYFEPFYKAELFQYYEIPFNQDLFPKHIDKNHKYRKTGGRMWMFSLDTLIIQYRNDGGNPWTGGTNYGAIQLGEREGFRYNFYAKTLDDAIHGASEGKRFDCRPDIEAFRQGEKRNDAINSTIESIKTLKTSFGITEIDGIVEQMKNLIK